MRSLLSHNRRGAGVPTVLVVSIVILGFVWFAAEMFIKLTFADQRTRVRRFSQISAESAAATAVSHILSDPRFGQDKSNDKVELPASVLGAHQTAYVQFAPDAGKPYSVNNMTSDTPILGFQDRVVPAYGAQIIGVGTYGGKTALYEIILVRPGITHAAASSGTLTLDGHNEAASLKTFQQLNEIAGGTVLDQTALEEELRATTVASSGSTPEPLVLKGDLTLYGDAISASGIQQDGTVRFLHGGGPLTNQTEVEIPTIDEIEAYDPAGQTGTTDLEPSYSDANNLFVGRNRIQGDLTINGDLELNGALIYVTGNLTVTGNIKGDGALVSLGNMNLTGHSTLEADSKVAVLSKGDLTLTGRDADRSLFSGLLYSEGKVSASRVTVVGGIVANNPENPEAASMEVTDTRLINLPEKTKFEVIGQVDKDPDPPQGGPFFDRLRDLGITLIPPDLNTLLKDDGTWNGAPVVFRFSKGGLIYDSLSQIPGLSASALTNLRLGESRHMDDWVDWLEDREPTSQQETIFLLDPNQLLTVSGGYRVVIRRPLDGLN